jgi:hypothetical protein
VDRRGQDASTSMLLAARRRPGPSRRCAPLLLVGVLSLAAAFTPSAAFADNPIVTENQQPGTSAWELGTEATDSGGQIKGYASATSVNKGDSIDFFVSVKPAQTFTIDVYRMGYYQGSGGRLMQHVGPLNGVQQPTCPTDSTTGLIACNWSRSYTLQTQTSWTTGVYQAVLTNAAHYQNAIIFVVRDDGRIAQLLYQLPVNTYQAYNDYPDDGRTGKSLYTYNSYGARTVTGDARAAKVSFDRPYNGPGYGQFLSWDVNLVRWLEKSGYDVSYSTDVDTHANGSRLLGYRGFLAAAHNEYWSKGMYDAVAAARDAGVNLAFFGANAIYWQVRYEPSAAGVPNRVIVCYKDGSIDPTGDPSLTTINWRDPPLNRPEQTLIGVQYTAEMRNDAYYPYVVTNSSNWVYAGTGFRDGDSVPGLVGYEGDHFFSSYPGPNAVTGTFTLLSRSPYTNSSGQADFANSSIYQAPSGAWVFGSGTIAWGWGLDDYGNRGALDSRIQQTTANILNRFTASPPANIAAPSGLTASATSTSAIALTWTDNSSNEDSFVLERSNSSSFASVSSTTLPAGTTSYTDTGLSSGTYYYRVKAVNATDQSAYSNTASAATLPAAPSNLSATPTSGYRVSLAWTDNASNETAYVVERSTAGGPWVVLNGSLAADATGYVDTTVKPLTDYAYRVKATNAGGSSGYAGPASLTTPDDVPAAPANLAATRTGTPKNQSVTLTWADAATNESGFVLQRATDASFSSNLTAVTLPANTTRTVDSTVRRSTTYWYRVYAFNGIGASSFSNVVSVRTK